MKILSLILFSTIVIAQSPHQPSAYQEEGHRTGRIKVSDGNKKELINLLELNESLYKAYATERLGKVGQLAKDAIKIIDKVVNPELMATLFLAKINLEGLSQNKKVNHYEGLSEALSVIVQRYDIGPGYNVFYCQKSQKKWVLKSAQKGDIYYPFDKKLRNCWVQKTKF